MSGFLAEDISNVISRCERELKKLEGKRILLTGAAGFLGRYFLQIIHTYNKNHSNIFVSAVDNFAVPGSGKEVFSEFKSNWLSVLNANICKKEDLLPIKNVDIIVHAAGIASPFYYRAKPLETLEVATTATRNLLELAEKCSARFTFFSSSEIYGDPNPSEIPIKESYRGNVSCLGPRACYDESKRLGETLCYIFHEYHGVATNIIRPFNVYGPGMGKNDYRVMPNFAARIQSGDPLEVYGRGTQTRTFCYITDALVGFIKVFCNGVPGEPYNVGNPDGEITMNELAELFVELSDKSVVVKVSSYPDSYPQDEPNRRCPDITKLKIQLNFEPEVDLKEGVSRFLSWTSKHYG